MLLHTFFSQILTAMAHLIINHFSSNLLPQTLPPLSNSPPFFTYRESSTPDKHASALQAQCGLCCHRGAREQQCQLSPSSTMTPKALHPLSFSPWGPSFPYTLPCFSSGFLLLQPCFPDSFNIPFNVPILSLWNWPIFLMTPTQTTLEPLPKFIDFFILKVFLHILAFTQDFIPL